MELISKQAQVLSFGPLTYHLWVKQLGFLLAVLCKAMSDSVCHVGKERKVSGVPVRCLQHHLIPSLQAWEITMLTTVLLLRGEMMSLGAQDETLVCQWPREHFQDWDSPVALAGLCWSPLPDSGISSGGPPFCYFVTGQELV